MENHDYIQCVKDDRRKMKNTYAWNHESDVNFELHLRGNSVVTIGYSRFGDKKKKDSGIYGTHGWVRFQTACTTKEQKDLAIEVMTTSRPLADDAKRHGVLLGQSREQSKEGKG